MFFIAGIVCQKFVPVISSQFLRGAPNNRFRHLTAIGYKNVDLNAMVEDVSVHNKISQGVVKNTDDTVMPKVRPSVNLDLHPPVALAQQSYPSIISSIHA